MFKPKRNNALSRRSLCTTEHDQYWEPIGTYHQQHFKEPSSDEKRNKMQDNTQYVHHIYTSAIYYVARAHH